MLIEINDKEFTARCEVISEDLDAVIKWETFEVMVTVNGFDIDVTSVVVGNEKCMDSLEKRIMSDYWSYVDMERSGTWND